MGKQAGTKMIGQALHAAGVIPDPNNVARVSILAVAGEPVRVLIDCYADEMLGEALRQPGVLDGATVEINPVFRKEGE